ncbi:uncharacterized protein LOC116620784 [Nematostella vectensis]|uniref:uncharacterized protein LOC116620784 n=1 Tax=Nematostella vectensis TaxID=45351 RepID=UPI0020779427|nr:uncharacterized protein LOC116620784 [Nematostella vectensis]
MTEMGKGCGTWSGNLVSWRDLRNSPRYGDVVIQEYSECYTPGVVTRSHRDQYCRDLIAAIPSASCSTPAYALFDTRVDLKNVMWRCYFANAVKTVVRDHTFAYDKDLLSACFYTRHGELTMIQD